MRAGVELAQGASAGLDGSYFSVAAAALVVEDNARLAASGNIFVRSARPPVPAIRMGDAVHATLRRNVFIGYGTEIVKGVSAGDRQQILSDNVIVTAEPSPVR
jgi:hypothetical protein